MYTGAMDPFCFIGVHPSGGVLAGRLLGNRGWVPSKAEEPVDMQWTVTVVGAD